MNNYPRHREDESREELQERIDAYDSIDWFDEGKENAQIRDESAGLMPTDGNYSLDDLPF